MTPWILSLQYKTHWKQYPNYRFHFVEDIETFFSTAIPRFVRMKCPSERSYKSNSYKSRYKIRSKASQRKRFMYIKFEQIEMGKGFILLKLVQIEIVIFCRFIKKRSFCIDFIDLM